MKIKISDQMIVYTAWALAWIATLTSLYFSEVLHWRPCSLCWYQRILIYPLILIIGTAIIRKDQSVPYYVLPMTVLGMFISGYHTLLQWGIVAESLAPCEFGVSCIVSYTNWFGFITIPFLAFITFAAITILMTYYLKGRQKNA